MATIHQNLENFELKNGKRVNTLLDIAHCNGLKSTEIFDKILALSMAYIFVQLALLDIVVNFMGYFRHYHVPYGCQFWAEKFSKFMFLFFQKEDKKVLSC